MRWPRICSKALPAVETFRQSRTEHSITQKLFEYILIRGLKYPIMEVLETNLQNLRRENIYQRMFVPELSLYHVMSKDAVEHALVDMDVKKHQKEEISTKIFEKGRKIFGTLILIGQAVEVLKFIEADELDDIKLPFKTAVLKDEIRLTKARAFEEKQWEFSAPTFLRGTLNRRLRDKIVLPFTNREYLSRGAFGEVFLIELDEHHQESNEKFPPKFVQKALDSAKDHQAELENLSILNHLKHPNIVKLLASYTHQNKHNLLFPIAEGGTLAQLLQTKREDTRFRSDKTFLSALADLSSAVEHVHNFFDRRLDLRLIGCHHDLRPRNILVSENTFILADFGLSRFKDPSQDSITPFRAGMDDYLAPECEDIEANFDPLKVRRSSDIWSFGCIIAEAASYLAMGENAIHEFKMRREVVVRGWKFHNFHLGYGKSADSVADWLSKLELFPVRSCKFLVWVVRQMLVLDQSKRPKASMVTHWLRLIALDEIAASLDELFSSAEASSQSLDIVIERKRFESWRHAIGVLDLRTTLEALDHADLSKGFDFHAVQHYLDQLSCALSPGPSRNEHERSGFAQLYQVNDQLRDQLDSDQQERLRNFFRISLMNHLDKTLIGENLVAESGQFLDRDIRTSLALKHMTELTMARPTTDSMHMQVGSSTVRLKSAFGEHQIAELINREHKQLAIVEWRIYGPQGADRNISQELFKRISSLAQLMSMDKPNGMRALRCRGYFHEESQKGFGMVYDFPQPSPDAETSPSEPSQSMPTTLHEVIRSTANQVSRHPVLDEKFKLASQLARTVLEFHLVGWLHKAINAWNIAFFPSTQRSISTLSINPSSATVTSTLANPYVIGFNHSRPDDPLAITQGTPSSAVALGYQHPIYRRNTRGYRAEYDYYSLGVVLIEIGYWRPLHEIIKMQVNGKVYRPEYDEVIKNRIKLLAQYMGQDYADAVNTCIFGHFHGAEADEESSGQVDINERGRHKRLFVEFETQVLNKLTKFCL